MTPEQKETLDKLQSAALNGADLRLAEYADGEGLEGFCYVITEAMWYAHPGAFEAHRYLHQGGGSHWYLRTVTHGKVVECNKVGGSPFDDFAYNGRKTRFLSFPYPSKRTKSLAARAGVTLNVR